MMNCAMVMKAYQQRSDIMPKIKCEWTSCNHNDSEYSDSCNGNCTFEGEIYLKHGGDNSEGENILICSGFKWGTKAMKPKD
jgi:hypothetical protein